MNRVREYMPQIVLASLQSLVVLMGSMFTATILKAFGYPESRAHWPPASVFVRNWGVSLVLIPFIWVIATIWMERLHAGWFSRRWTILSGLLILIGLAYFLDFAPFKPTAYLIEASQSP